MPRKVTYEDGTPAGWITPAGNMHPTEAEALAEENASTYEARVELFIRSKSWNRGQDTRARALITEFLANEDTLPALDQSIASMAATLEAEREAVKAARKAARQGNAEVPAAPGIPAAPTAQAA